MPTRRTKLQKLLADCGCLPKVAAHCGVDRSAVYRWKSGSRVPSRQSAALLVGFFGRDRLTVSGCMPEDLSSDR